MLQDAFSITSREINSLVNILHEEGYERVTLDYPLLSTKLMEIDFSGEELIGIKKEGDFRTYNRRRIKDERLKGEVAYFSDLKEALITSRCLPLKNEEEVRETLLNLYKITHDPREVLRERYLGIDTNIAYLRFPSRFFPIDYFPKRYASGKDYKWVVSEIVWREVDSSIQEKYLPRQIEEMRRIFRGERYINALLNASMKRSRKAKGALWELNYIRSTLNGFKIENSKEIQNKEARDIEIARDYGRFQKERDADVLLITADRDMEFHSRSEGVPSLLLVYNHEIPERLKCPLYSIINLLYDLATVFAVIKIKEVPLTIMGEWAGKNYQDREGQRLLVLPEGGEGIGIIKRLKKDVDVSRKVEEIISQ